MYTLQGHSGAANSASFSLDGGFFASAADDAIVMVWRTNFDGLPTNDNHLESGNPVPAIDSAARPTSPPAGGPIGKSPKSRRPSPSRPAPARPISNVEFDGTTLPKVKQSPQSNEFPPSTESQKVAKTLEYIVQQLEVVTRTLGVFERRLTRNEDIIQGFVSRMDASQNTICDEA